MLIERQPALSRALLGVQGQHEQLGLSAEVARQRGKWELSLGWSLFLKAQAVTLQHNYATWLCVLLWSTEQVRLRAQSSPQLLA